MSHPQRSGLTALSAIPVAIGSVAGAGILSLPSAVYVEAGTASTVVWGLAAAACIPMLLMFRDAMALSGDGDAVQTLVGRGLRTWVGSAMPLMFLAVVVIGLPTGGVVAGRYVEEGLPLPLPAPVVAGGILVVALVADLLGGTVGRGLQLVGAAVLLVTGAVLVGSGFGRAVYPVHVVPDPADWRHVVPGVLLAFWAFVGFENLTFLGRDLRRPARDFLPVSAVALGVYGVFALGSTLAVAATVDRGAVDTVTGLLQLATTPAAQAGVSLVALAAMLVNAAAWVRGVSRLVAGAARDGQLPRDLEHRPLLRTASLATLLGVTLAVLTIVPDLVVSALAASSAVFVVIYLICTVSYVRVVGLRLRTALNVLLVPAMIVTLVGSAGRSLYGLTVAVACLGWCFLIHRRRRRTSAPAQDV
jgi:amino acid efflux transporter